MDLSQLSPPRNTTKDQEQPEPSRSIFGITEEQLDDPFISLDPGRHGDPLSSSSPYSQLLAARGQEQIHQAPLFPQLHPSPNGEKGQVPARSFLPEQSFVPVDKHQTHIMQDPPFLDDKMSVGNYQEDCGGFYRDVFAHIQDKEPVALRNLQVEADITLSMNEPGDFGSLVSALEYSKVQKKTKEKVEKSITNFIVHGFVYEYSPYSPTASEKDVLTATDGKNRSNLMKQWDVNMCEWAKKHRIAYGNMIETRKKAFHGIICETAYRRINHLKTARLSTFYKKVKNEAQEQLTYWSMLKIYPQYNN